MPILSGFLHRLQYVYNKQDTVKEFFLSYFDRIMRSAGKDTSFYHRERTKRLMSKISSVLIKENDCYRIKNIRLPLLDVHNEHSLVSEVFGDTFWSYAYCDDKYDEETFDKCDKFLGEGLYGLVNDKVNVTVKAGDIVIDAGSWIGDFAAYAAVKGAKVYAFEPSERTFQLLEQTARLNGNIIPVKKGLSDTNTIRQFFFDVNNNSSGDGLSVRNTKTKNAHQVETVTIDDFVRENNLPRVDFIKSDIEGFERHMLAGAQETLRCFAPKLALCTYHLPDDPQVMAELILKANPKYNIVQKRMKLFASVPD